jgi:hypothetical protein
VLYRLLDTQITRCQYERSTAPVRPYNAPSRVHAAYTAALATARGCGMDTPNRVGSRWDDSAVEKALPT